MSLSSARYLQLLIRDIVKNTENKTFVWFLVGHQDCTRLIANVVTHLERSLAIFFPQGFKTKGKTL